MQESKQILLSVTQHFVTITFSDPGGKRHWDAHTLPWRSGERNREARRQTCAAQAGHARLPPGPGPAAPSGSPAGGEGLRQLPQPVSPAGTHREESPGQKAQGQRFPRTGLGNHGPRAARQGPRSVPRFCPAVPSGPQALRPPLRAVRPPPIPLPASTPGLHSLVVLQGALLREGPQRNAALTAASPGLRRLKAEGQLRSQIPTSPAASVAGRLGTAPRRGLKAREVLPIPRVSLRGRRHRCHRSGRCRAARPRRRHSAVRAPGASRSSGGAWGVRGAWRGVACDGAGRPTAAGGRAGGLLTAAGGGAGAGAAGPSPAGRPPPPRAAARGGCPEGRSRQRGEGGEKCRQ